MISYQVVQEFLNVATRKFVNPLTLDEAGLYLDQVLMPLCELYPNDEFYQFGLNMQKLTRYSFYDSLMIAAAVKTNCKVLYSEDLHQGQIISGLVIHNPFKQ